MPPLSVSGGANREWLETDGLGGFASGSVAGMRARRYHALLLTATTPPTVWPWLMGAFVEAWLRTRGNDAQARREARTRFLDPLLVGMDAAGLDHISEIADGDLPHAPRGCPFQAWSVAEALRLDRVVLHSQPSSATSPLRSSASRARK
jgi:glycogen debranching enzyme